MTKQPEPPAAGGTSFDSRPRLLIAITEIKRCHREAAAWLLLPGLLWLASVQAFGQSAATHHFTGIRALPDRMMALDLGGGALPVFNAYFDLYVIESSSDLVDWKALATLVRTNASTNDLTYMASNAATLPQKFYRAWSNSLVTPFLPPGGPFPVGTSVRKLTDPSRTNRYNIATNSSFMVTFWYPAQRPSGRLPAHYTDPRLATYQPYWGTFTNVVPVFVSHALPDASIIDGGELYPIIVYTHGGADGISEGGTAAGVRGENTATAVELASHGYVVVAIDHIDCYGSVFPDGTRVLRGFTFGNVINNAATYLSSRFHDIQFVVGELRQLAQTDPVFANRLDLDHVGIMGWSFGGGTAAEACRTNDQIKAAVLLDGYLDPVPALSIGLQKPFLAMNSPSTSLAGSATTLFNKATNNAYTLQISNALHETFTDQAWITGHTAGAREAARAKDACVVSFFDKYFKGQDDHLLDEPSAAFSNVFGFLTKALRIATQPQSRNAVRGANVSLSVVATSARPITYQWQFNETNLIGAITNTLLLNNVQAVNAGTYRAVVTDGAATLTSQPAVLNVGERPVITMQPQNQTAVVGSDVTFSVTASGTLPLWFRWRNPSTVTNMMLQTNVSFLTILNVQFNTPSNYTVAVTNLFGSSALSSTAVLTVTSP